MEKFMNPNELKKLPPNQDRRKPKYHWLFSYSGLALTSFYAFLAIAATISDQQRYYSLGGGGCNIACFDGFHTHDCACFNV
jgi:hypothetical protein